LQTYPLFKKNIFITKIMVATLQIPIFNTKTNMKRISILILFIVIYNAMKSQPIISMLDTSQHEQSFRGLCPVSDNIIWVSGNNGKVGKSLNGGNTWQWYTIPGFEKRDFRDIEAFDGAEAIVMCVDAPAYILQTKDGGHTWKVVHEDTRKGIFLDAMMFWNEQSGMIVGDPINNHIVIKRTFDGGSTWKDLPENFLPVVDSTEALFAASGSNIGAVGSNNGAFITGGSKSRFFYKHGGQTLPIMQGTQSTGANSISVVYKKRKVKKMVIVGGDFANPTRNDSICIISTDKGKTWHQATTMPKGYRSCVDHINANHWVSCGITGVDYSMDGAMHWQPLSNIGFHVCRKAKKGNTIFLAGGNGRIAKIVWK
jgi:hypothetical protein